MIIIKVGDALFLMDCSLFGYDVTTNSLWSNLLRRTMRNRCTLGTCLYTMGHIFENMDTMLFNRSLSFRSMKQN